MANTNATGKQEYVTLSMKLVDWPHTDFKRTVKTSTTIRSIKEAIKQHLGVGSTKSIVLCLHTFEAKNELHNANATLKEYGINEDADIYYNFKTEEATNIDPILMC